jgi:cellulose synthase/poly-beta-1,6-N-acetylglucosamine synthase-like glycosyltransferase
MDLTAWVFWSSTAAILYVYLGYPLLVACGARLRSRLVHKGACTPTVTVVMAVYNEAAVVKAKLENLLALHYPADRFDVVVVSDGSTDGTDEMVKAYSSRNVRLIRLPIHEGKAQALNRGVAVARGEIVVFMDARQEVQAMALRRLAANFADETVGVVSGRLRLGAPEGQDTSGFGAYWSYEVWLRRHESRIDSMLGATGALYAIRRCLWEPLPPDTILDDVLIPMRIAMAGYRVVFEPEAVVFDRLAEQVPDEFARKVRTLAGNFQLLGRYPALLNPRRNRVWFQYLSHKVGRLAVPLCLLLVLISSAILREGWYGAAFGLQVLWYGTAVCAGIPCLQRLAVRAVRAATAIAAMNLAAVVGLAYLVAGRRDLWRRPTAVSHGAGATRMSSLPRIRGPV